MTIQDWAAQRCTISYRAPELFNVESHCIIDERTDIWVKPCNVPLFWLVYVVLMKPQEIFHCARFTDLFLLWFVIFSYSSSLLVVCFTAWWCWKDRMIWCFRRETVLPWLSRIQCPSHRLAGQSSGYSSLHQFLSLPWIVVEKGKHFQFISHHQWQIVGGRHF